MKVLLTGATGFVGSHLARALLRQGHEVHALVRPGASTWRIEDIRDELHTVIGDLADAGLSQQLDLVRPQLCLHLAWHVVPGRYLDAPENLRALELGLRLTRELARVGCRRFVGVGTCLEYAPANEPLTEQGPTRPDRLYAVAKLAFAQLLPHLTATTGMSTAWARLFYLYGPFEDERRLVPRVVKSLMAGHPVVLSAGEQVRDYLHVGDVAGALAAIARSAAEGVVNVGSGQPVTVRELVSQVGRLLGREDHLMFGAAPAPPGDPPYVCADNGRLLRETGFRPQFDLEKGLRQVVEWWSERGRRLQVDPT